MVIKSLGRLFLGRKWNPLRNRVDHVQLSKSEMFLGALAFTIGVFLFPTSIIYYIVFLSVSIYSAETFD
jgi:phosphatidylinositol glycan class Q protein